MRRLGADAVGLLTVSHVTATGNSSDGLNVGSSTVEVSCSKLSHNGAYGIYASLSGGTLTLDQDSLIGNTSGPYFLFGSGTADFVHTPCP